MTTFFHVSPSSGVPIYRQLLEQVERMIISGQLKPDELLPSVRQIASTLDVNPMTVSKAYSLLEDRGLIVRLRGKGMAVASQDETITNQERMKMLSPLIDELITQAKQLGVSKEQLLLLIKQKSED